MKHLFLYANKLNFQKKRIFFVKSLWKHKYKINFIYLFSKKKTQIFYSKPIFIENFKVKKFTRFGYRGIQNIYYFRSLTGLPIYKLTSQVKQFSADITLNYVNIFSQCNFEFNFFKIKHFNFTKENYWYFFDYFLLNTSFQIQSKLNYLKKNTVFLTNKTLNVLFLNNTSKFSNYYFNVLYSFKNLLKFKYLSYNKTYLNLFYLYNSIKNNKEKKATQSYFNLKFFYLYFFKNIEFKYLQLVRVQILKLKLLLKNKNNVFKISLVFLKLLIKKKIFSMLYTFLNYFFTKNFFFFSFIFCFKKAKNLKVKKLTANLLNLKKNFFDKKYHITFFNKKHILALPKKKINNLLILSIINCKFLIKKIFKNFFFKLNAYLNVVHFYIFDILKLTKKLASYIKQNLLYSLSLVALSKQYASVKKNNQNIYKNWNLFFYNKLLLNFAPIDNNSDNYVCNQFFEQLFVKYNQKYFKYFWKYSFLSNLNLDIVSTVPSQSFFFEQKQDSCSLYNFAFLKLKTKQLRLQKLLALSFFFSFLLDNYHWFYYFNVYMPNIKLKVITSNNDNLLTKFKLLSWFKKNQNNINYKKTLFFLHYKNKYLYLFFYEYLFFKQLFGLKNNNFVNFFYNNVSFNFFFNFYSYNTIHSLVDINNLKSKFFDSKHISYLDLNISRLHFYKNLMDTNFLTVNFNQINIHFKYLNDFFFF